MQATIIKSTGSWYRAKTDNGKYLDCRLKGKLRLDGVRTTNPVAVGDIVQLTETDQKEWVVASITERKNYIVRRSPKNRFARQIVAANIDQAILVCSISSPRTSTGFVDRFLVCAEAYYIPALIVMNKADIRTKKDQRKFEEWKEIYTLAGYELLDCSVETKFNLDLVKERMKSKINLVVGHSGVGKSSLINAISPALDLRINTISKIHDKGMHTTTVAEMYELEEDIGVIDSPGIKEFMVLDTEAAEVSHYFKEMRTHLTNCKFNNCLHMNEPSCAVMEAAQAGKIHIERYTNYLNIVDDVQNEKGKDLYT